MRPHLVQVGGVERLPGVCIGVMWIALLMLVAFIAGALIGFLAEFGLAAYVAVIAALATFGANPEEPLIALATGAGAFWALRLLAAVLGELFSKRG